MQYSLVTNIFRHVNISCHRNSFQCPSYCCLQDTMTVLDWHTSVFKVDTDKAQKINALVLKQRRIKSNAATLINVDVLPYKVWVQIIPNTASKSRKTDLWKSCQSISNSLAVLKFHCQVIHWFWMVQTSQMYKVSFLLEANTNGLWSIIRNLV